MGSKSSRSSSSDSLRGFTVPNLGEKSVSEIIGKHEYNNYTNSKGEVVKENPTGHKFYLVSIHYYYKNVGSHRIIQACFHCNSCICGWYVYTDKTSNGSKNINISKKDFFEFNDKEGDGYWTFWNYWVKKNKTFTYWNFLNLYHDAPSGYHLIKNNCADFARYIWKRAPY